MGRGGGGASSPMNGGIWNAGCEDSASSILIHPGTATWTGLQNLLTLRAWGALRLGPPKVEV